MPSMRGMLTSVSTRSTALCLREVERLDAVRGLHDSVAGAFERKADHLPHRRGIVDGEDHLAGRRLDLRSGLASRPTVVRDAGSSCDCVG